MWKGKEIGAVHVEPLRHIDGFGASANGREKPSKFG